MSWACSQYGQYAPGGAHHGWGGAGHSHLAVHHHPYSAHVPGPPPSGVPPGDLHGRPRRGRSRSKSSRARSRSRSPRRVKSSVKTVRASDLKMDLGKEAFSKLVLECLLLLSPGEFGDIWVGIPRQLLAVAWGPPPGVVVEHWLTERRGAHPDVCQAQCTEKGEVCPAGFSEAAAAPWGWELSDNYSHFSALLFTILGAFPLASFDYNKWVQVEEHSQVLEQVSRETWLSRHGSPYMMPAPVLPIPVTEM